MSYSLMVANGDLSFNGYSLDTVDNEDKLIQDLALWILEPMGTDQLNPSYGSLIDGGIDTNGNVSSGVIGTPNSSLAAATVTAEIQRICLAYQQQQQNRFTDDVQTYGTSTITAGEALLAVGSISAVPNTDSLNVSVTLTTGTGDLPITVPITTGTGAS